MCRKPGLELQHAPNLVPHSSEGSLTQDAKAVTGRRWWTEESTSPMVRCCKVELDTEALSCCIVEKCWTASASEIWCYKETRWLGMHKQAGTRAGNHQRHTQLPLCATLRSVLPTHCCRPTFISHPRAPQPMHACNCESTRMYAMVQNLNMCTALSFAKIQPSTSWNLCMHHALSPANCPPHSSTTMRAAAESTARSMTSTCSSSTASITLSANVSTAAT